jgi:Uma2 family endonuclease
MPVDAIAEPEILVPKRKRWTRAECRALESTGLCDTRRLELIEGDLIEKMSKNRPHVNTMIFVREWLIGVFGLRHVTPEAPIDVAADDNPTSEPEPDLAVLAQPCTAYETSNPLPSDVRLVVEISNSTLGFDRNTKSRLYARAGIVEYWVVDVTGRRIVVHCDPQDGVYSDVKLYSAGESIEPLSAPGKAFPVDDAFGGKP